MAERIDPYEYLEDSADPRTVAWTAEQNRLTRAALDGLPLREGLRRRFERLLRTDVLGVPVERAGRLFLTARRGAADQPVLSVKVGGVERVLVDPASADPDALVALDWWYPSPSGRYLAFGLSRAGDERSTLHLLDVDRAEPFGETIPNTRYASLGWLPDESGFFYTRYPPGADYGQRVYRHALGAAWEDDVEIFAARTAEEMLNVALSADGRRLVIVAHRGWSRSDAYLADTALRPLHLEPLAEGEDDLYDVVPTNETLFVRTDAGAPRFRVFAVDPDRPARAHWREIVPEAAGSLEGIEAARGGLALQYVENVASVLRVRRSDGSIEDVAGFAGRSIAALSGHEDGALYVLHESFLEAPAIARVTFDDPTRAGAIEELELVRSDIDPLAYVVGQEWFVSKDGTRVPMYVLSRANLARDGRAPAVLYGYGGFAISLLPSFSPQLAPWLDAGGVYAVANLRGGGEFGEAWHRAGMREHKQNVFDDFIAAAEHLARSGIADPERIAIAGGSNGGLLVAAVAVQRPDLVRAVLCLVPLTDMLRYHLFLIGRLWIPEYGNPDDPADAAVLRAYSPYHNVRDGAAYPAMLILTAESDGRVDPMHARKFAARVQAASAGGAPTFVHVESEAGHGAGKPRRKIVEELADRWSFLFDRLGVAGPEG